MHEYIEARRFAENSQIDYVCLAFHVTFVMKIVKFDIEIDIRSLMSEEQPIYRYEIPCEAYIVL